MELNCVEHSVQVHERWWWQYYPMPDVQELPKFKSDEKTLQAELLQHFDVP